MEPMAGQDSGGGGHGGVRREEQGARLEAVRRFLKAIVTSTGFTCFIFMCIAFNTVTIGINDVSVQRDPGGLTRRIIDISDWFILSAFTLEMLLKIGAMGLGFRDKGVQGESEEEARVRKFDDDESGGYLSSGWNRFDAIVVVLSWVLILVQVFVQNNSNIARLVSIFRIARPLRALRSFEGTQDILKTFPAAVPAMRDVITLLLFVFFVYAILGVNLFGLDGELHGRCVVATDEYGTRGELQQGFLSDIAPVCGGEFKCSQGFRCSCTPQKLENGTSEQPPYAFQDPVTGDRGCLAQGSPRPWSDGGVTFEPMCPSYGYECFDNFPMAVLSCFWSITMDSWTFRMWWAQDANSEIIGWLYYSSLVVFVSFNIVNLNVAVISSAYKEVRERRRMINKLRKKLRNHAQINKPMSLPHRLQAQGTALTRAFFARPRREDLPVLNPLARLARTVTMYPNKVDECGAVVGGDVLAMLSARGLRVSFGPGKGQWTLRAGKHMCQRIRPTAAPSTPATPNTAASPDGFPPSTPPAPPSETDASTCAPGSVVASGESRDAGREALVDAVLCFAELDAWEGGGGGGPAAARAQPVSSTMDVVLLYCIFANTILMAMEHFNGTPVLGGAAPPSRNCCDALCTEVSEEGCTRGVTVMSRGWRDALFWGEGTFNVIFTVETIIRLVSAWSLRGYVIENFPTNVVDLLIVVASDLVFILDIFYPNLLKIAMFRLIRVLRAFRVVSRFRRLKVLLNKAVASFKTILHVLFVLIFWHVVSALLGMQIFPCDARDVDVCGEGLVGEGAGCPEGCSVLIGGTCFFTDEEMYDNCPWNDEHNFNSFGMAMIELIFVLTGENWVDTMQNGMRAYRTMWVGLIYFMIFYIIAFYMLFNLFIGVILEEFEMTDEEKEGLQMGFYRVNILKEIKRQYARKDKDGKEHAVALESATDMMGDMDMPEGLADDAHLSAPAQDEKTILFCLPPPQPSDKFPDAPRNLRGYVRLITSSIWFERVILAAIVASSVLLALDSPIREYATIGPEITKITDVVFFVVFLLEFVLKVLDNGVYWESRERSYFRSNWNILDFVILTFQVLDVIGISGLKSLRAMRVARPLRLLNKIKSLQLLLLSVHSSAGDMLNVLLLWMFAFFVFAILGINLFKGKLWSCNDGDFTGYPLNPSEPIGSPVGYREGCVGNFYTLSTSGGTSYVADDMPTGIFKPRVWSNPSNGAGIGYNFDHFGIAVQTLFEVSTFEEWGDVVMSIVGATAVGQQPIPLNNLVNVVYVHAWLILSCFFVLQLVIGVLIDAINQKSGTALCTDLQRNWIRMQDKMRSLKGFASEQEPLNTVRRAVYRFVNTAAFQGFITVVIVVNILLMTTESHRQAEWWSAAMRDANWFFTAVYLLEILLKLFALMASFFRDPWNLFDVVVVLSTVVEMGLGPSGGVGLQALRGIRILKVFRTLRLVRRARRLRLMIAAVLGSIPPIISSLVCFGLFLFFFASLGVQFFSGVREGVGIHRRNNFNDTWHALVLLMRVATGENWETTMRDCGIEPPYCTTNEEAQRILGDPGAVGDCGSTIGAFLFFDIFYLLGTNILVNLFVAVLLENFFMFQMQSSFLLSDAHLESYQRCWQELDPQHHGTLPILKFRELIAKLHGDKNPLGECVLASELKFRSVRMEIIEGKQEGEELVFNDTLLILGLHVVGSHGLTYPEMMKRQERLAHFSRLAAVSKITRVYRSLKHYHPADADAEKHSQGSPARTPARSFWSGLRSSVGRAEEEADDETDVALELVKEQTGTLVTAARGNKERIRRLAWREAGFSVPPMARATSLPPLRQPRRLSLIGSL